MAQVVSSLGDWIGLVAVVALAARLSKGSSAAFASLAGLASWLGHFDALHALKVNQESLALWVDAATFLCSALLISTLTLPGRTRDGGGRIDWGQTWRELVEGLRFIRRNEAGRSVMLGVGGGVIGCGAVGALGPVSAQQVLGSGSAGVRRPLARG